MTFKIASGHVLVDITKEAIVECFDLERSAIKGINKDRLKREYYAKKDLYRKNVLPLFLKKLYQGEKGYLLESKKEPLNLTLFEDYFSKRYYDLCQVLGEDCGLEMMPMKFMMITMKIQHSDTNELYDFATIIQEKMHEGLIKAKNPKKGLNFKHYSLLSI